MAKEFTGNENRARLYDSRNTPTPRTADGSPVGTTGPGEMPPGILNGNSVPMVLDSHSQGRHSHENMERKPGEVSRSARTSEVRHRIYGRDAKYK
jgi:hypothetical protein